MTAFPHGLSPLTSSSSSSSFSSSSFPLPDSSFSSSPSNTVEDPSFSASLREKSVSSSSSSSLSSCLPRALRWPKGRTFDRSRISKYYCAVVFLAFIPIFYYLSTTYLAPYVGWIYISEPDDWSKVVLEVRDYNTEGFFSHLSVTSFMIARAYAKGLVGVHVRFTTFPYLDKDRGMNWFAYFFQDKMWFNTSELPATTHIEYFDSKNAEIVGWRAYTPQQVFLSDDSSYFQEVSTAVHKFLRIQPDIVNEFHSLSLDTLGITPRLPSILSLDEGHKDDTLDACVSYPPSERCKTFRLGVQIRLTDRVEPGKELDRINILVGEVQKVLSHLTPFGDYCQFSTAKQTHYYGCKYLVYVASDVRAALDRVEETFPNGTVRYLTGIPRSDGYLPLHRNHLLPPYLQGKSVLMDGLHLSQCHYLVRPDSTVSDAAILWNPAILYSYFHDEVEWFRRPAWT